jgi:hypothetical protein
MENTNFLMVLGGFVFLPLFYFFLYVFRQDKPWLPTAGLFLMTFGSILDGCHWIYPVTYAVGAVCALWGCVKHHKPMEVRPPF